MASNGESDLAHPRVYVKGEILKVEEDLQHEFKGHRNFAKEQIPLAAIINKSQQPVSRNLCGFLNTGVGGIVYCGVTDDGTVEGLRLTEYQKDHVLVAVQDVFSRFHPPVSSDRFSIRIVPVVPDKESTTIIPHPVDAEQRKQPHLLRTSRYCWCDNDAAAQLATGMINREYVIEIHVFPWNPMSKLSVTPSTPIQPLFRNEDGMYYIRRLGSLHQPTLSEVIQLAEADTIRYHTLKDKGPRF